MDAVISFPQDHGFLFTVSCAVDPGTGLEGRHSGDGDPMSGRTSQLAFPARASPSSCTQDTVRTTVIQTFRNRPEAPTLPGYMG